MTLYDTEPPESKSLRAAAMDFHERNPLVYEQFKVFALQVIAKGRVRFGVAMIWERMRWYTTIETRGEPWKLNNNHRAYYARMFMDEFPEHEGIFQLRTVSSEE